jgi:hypothetical protein
MVSHGLTSEVSKPGPEHASRWMPSVMVCGLSLHMVATQLTGQGTLLWASPLALVVAAVMPAGLVRWERDGSRLRVRALAYLFLAGGPLVNRWRTPPMATTSWRCVSPRSACGGRRA